MKAVRMFSALRQMARDPEGKVLLASAVTALALGTIVYSVLEGWSLLDSLYFSVVTLATVGFGDLVPTTDGAKLFTIGYIILGIGILAGFASELLKFRGTPIVNRLHAASTIEHVVVEDTAKVVDVARGPGPDEGR
jgi:voltage-gated potassium channel